MTNARKAAHARVSIADTTAWWSTAVTDIEPGVIRLRGYPIEQLIGSVSFPATAYLMLRGELPSAPQAELLEMALVAAVDHGPQAPSIAAARMAATCGVGLNTAVATGVNLLGDVHGGAGQQCLEILDVLVARSDVPLAEAVTDLLADFRARNAHVPGFGHRFHPHDPRRGPLLTAVAEHVTAGHLAGRHLRAAQEIERQLNEHRSRPVPMNIDGATAVIYGELGFEPELARGLFVLSRAVGILAHAWEERSSGRRIKGPLPPPLLADYDGTPPRDVAGTDSGVCPGHGA
ncbi:citryl-CoA lyase [Dactylosporangium sucinum]|uniref:citrate synthase (unknown stereospecificity) n=1 Tax=Dactylosporangium sucinum TaxID=1424081 RepID=A0A917UCZ6_9ACTN|nr:citryl-CoA lyase [Dactylosporangium sucinum]GGM71298.1 citryl-CoA lyase [Dactylosporangium sucinum]